MRRTLKEDATMEAEAIARFTNHYSHVRYHETLRNATRDDIYFGREE